MRMLLQILVSFLHSTEFFLELVSHDIRGLIVFPELLDPVIERVLELGVADFGRLIHVLNLLLQPGD